MNTVLEAILSLVIEFANLAPDLQLVFIGMAGTIVAAFVSFFSV